MALAVRLFSTDRRCLLLILPLALLLFTTHLGRRDLWAPDEPRTGIIVREILESGSWSVLHDDGHPYLEKPPLYFWLAAAGSLPSGRVSEFTARLPSNLAALLGVLCLFYLGRGLFGRRVGALAAVVLSTTQDYVMEARWAHTDMLFCVLLCFACLAFHRAYQPVAPPGWLAAFYLAMGLAVLAKGPAGLLLPAVSVVVFLAVSRDLAFLKSAGARWGVPLALAPTALWLLAYRAKAGEPFPVGDSLSRLLSRVTQGLHHTHPLAHIVTSLPIEFLPWVLLLPGSVAHTFPRRGTRKDIANAYVYSWVTVLLAVFTFSAEKRGVYLLPLVPFLALLVGRVWDTALLGWEPSPVERTISWSLPAGLVLALAAAAYYLPRVNREAPTLRGPAMALAGAAILTALVAVAAHLRFGGGAGLGVFAGGLAACYLVVAVQVLPALDAYKSARPFSQRVQAAVGSAPLAIYRDDPAAYVFYIGRRIEVLPGREALEAFLISDPRIYCLMEESRYEALRPALDLKILDRQRIGHRSMLLVGGGRT